MFCDLPKSTEAKDNTDLIALCEDFLHLSDMISSLETPRFDAAVAAAVRTRWWSLLADIDALPPRTQHGCALRLRVAAGGVAAIR
jgi:hypothetical protein